MKNFVCWLLLVGFLIPVPVAYAEEPETLYWEDLIPPESVKALEEAYAAAAAGATPLNETPVPGENGGTSSADLDDPAGTLPAATQIGTFDVVEELNGQSIRIPGFMVPFDINQSNEVTEFLLVPYFGACIHVPPPPPNQIVYVTSDEAVPFGWEPVWLEGVLETTRHDNNMGNAAYTLNLTKLEPYTDG